MCFTLTKNTATKYFLISWLISSTIDFFIYLCIFIIFSLYSILYNSFSITFLNIYMFDFLVLINISAFISIPNSIIFLLGISLLFIFILKLAGFSFILVFTVSILKSSSSSFILFNFSFSISLSFLFVYSYYYFCF